MIDHSLAMRTLNVRHHDLSFELALAVFASLAGVLRGLYDCDEPADLIMTIHRPNSSCPCGWGSNPRQHRRMCNLQILHCLDAKVATNAAAHCPELPWFLGGGSWSVKTHMPATRWEHPDFVVIRQFWVPFTGALYASQ